MFRIPVRFTAGSTSTKDLFMADGYQGQSVIIIPSRKLILVRLGKGGWKKREVVEQLLEAVR